MIQYHYITKNPRLFKAFTGHSVDQFHKLLPLFTFELELYSHNFTRNGHIRYRAFGGGCKSTQFDKPSKLLALTLFYIRAYPTFDLLQILFCIDKAAIHRHICLGIKLLEKALKSKVPLPARKATRIEHLFTLIPELEEYIIDATEQPINRPKYNQKQYYSGKKKRHTIKRQIIVTPDKKVISISSAVEGKKHDKTLAEETMYFTHAPPGSTGLSDLGYQGIDIKGFNLKIAMPIKKVRGKKLSNEDKQTNRVLSGVRVRAEHVIAQLKFNRIFSDKIRYRLDQHNRIANVVAGMYNLKLET